VTNDANSLAGWEEVYDLPAWELLKSAANPVECFYAFKLLEIQAAEKHITQRAVHRVASIARLFPRTFSKEEKK
jgi:hypothetical protein